MRLETSFVVPPHDPLPNLDKMNAEAPQEEWGVNPFNGVTAGNGHKTGRPKKQQPAAA